MKRRQPPVVVDVPVRLLERPSTPEQIEAWGPYVPGQCDEIEACYRWIEARRAWCAETGADYRKTFTTSSRWVDQPQINARRGPCFP